MDTTVGKTMTTRASRQHPMFSHPVADVAVSLALGVWGATKRTRIRAGGLSEGGA
jgi:hypothetical protein